MFGEFTGLPVHALVLHAAVVLAPMAALVGIGSAVPRWRAALRWPLVALAAVAVATVFVAMQSGQVLKDVLADQLNGNITGDVVAQHEQTGGRLWIALLVFFALSVLSAVTGPRAARPHVGRAWAGSVVAPMTALVAVAVLMLTYQTGEAGARARWNPDGSFDYSGE